MTDKKPSALDELAEYFGDDMGDMFQRAVREEVQRQKSSQPGTEDHEDAVLNAIQDGRYDDVRQLTGKHR